MGRRRSSKRPNDSIGAKDYGDEGGIDLEDPELLMDDVERFHEDRDKIRLSGAKRKGDSDSSDGEEEVLGVAPESDSDYYNEEEESGEDDSDMESDIEGNEKEYLPSADAWGKKRSTFYNTDYIDDEKKRYSDSDAEVAELEEIEARNLQKRLAQQINEEDYLLDLPQTSTDSKTKKPESQEIEKIVTDLDKLTEQERIELFEEHCPELPDLLADYQEKKHWLECMEPLMTVLRQKPNKAFDQLQKIVETYGNYLVNISFYLWLKSTAGLKNIAQTKNHPVIDRIVQWKKLAIKADSLLETLNPQIDFLMRELKDGNDLFDCLAVEKPVAAAGVKHSKTEQNGDNLDEFGQFEEDNDYENDDERRAITNEMIRNRGLTPHKAKRHQRHSRVKRRRHFDKALIKKRSQIADVRPEMQRYGGEARGIKSGLVRSVKLK